VSISQIERSRENDASLLKQKSKGNELDHRFHEIGPMSGIHPGDEAL